MEIATAMLQHALDVGDAYKQNMALQHGLERPQRITLDKAAEPAATQQPVIPAPQVPPQQQPVARAQSLWPWLATTAAIALGSGGIGAATAVLSRPEAPQPIVVQQEPQQPSGDDGLLADLQERGFHLPPAKVQP